MENLPDHLQTRKELFEKFRLKDTPFVIFCGESIDDIRSYVCVSGKVYGTQENLKPAAAVDICFKAYTALRLDFAVACESTWLYLEKEVYGLTELHKKYPRSISKLLVDLGD